MSEQANAVLEKMREGRPLVGSIGDYRSPFRLEAEDTWDDVGYAVVRELIDSGKIGADTDRGDGQVEYRPRAI